MCLVFLVSFLVLLLLLLWFVGVLCRCLVSFLVVCFVLLIIFIYQPYKRFANFQVRNGSFRDLYICTLYTYYSTYIVPNILLFWKGHFFQNFNVTPIWISSLYTKNPNIRHSRILFMTSNKPNICNKPNKHNKKDTRVFIL